MFRSPIGPEAELLLLQEQHAAELAQLVARNRAYLQIWLPWVENSRSTADTCAFVRSALGQFARNDGFQAGVVFRGQLAGVVGYHGIDWASRRTSLGYWLGQEFQGRGLMTQACRALVRHAFDDLGLHRIGLWAAVDNGRSRAVAERLGFRLEGVERQTEWLHDRFTDHARYGLLAPEWRVRPQRQGGHQGSRS